MKDNQLSAFPSFDEESYPSNWNTKLESLLKREFDDSEKFLLATGYSSLDYLIDFFGKIKSSESKKVRIVLGNEPFINEAASRNKYYSFYKDLDQKIFDYWVQQGISPIQSSSIINLIELVKNGTIEFRILDNLHAKIYVGEQYSVIGSSNFSYTGLRYQLEGNFRVSKHKSDFDYIQQYKLADQYFDKGKTYNQRIIELLERLLRVVSWKEALARAIAELTEGEWLNEYPEFLKLLDNLNPPLWKSQIEAIGQALYILDNIGSLLIADPTGSGKTRLGAVLHSCLINRLWLRGSGYEMENTNTLLISPPQVIDNWKEEFRSLNSDFENVLSQGRLSVGTDKSIEETNHKIDNAKILFIDEAHNFLNKGSKRSLTIQYNTADNLVLYTATPINRRVEDLFRLIEILDVDNLDDNSIKEFEKLSQLARKGFNIGRDNEKRLREYIRDFIIRRTKKELNDKISETPSLYKNSNGVPCQYPIQNCKSYSLNEPESDIEIAKQINKLATELKGLIRLRNIFLSRDELKDAEKQERILESRFNSAKALTIYNLQATLRSSRIALIEHLAGTEIAKKTLDEIGYPIPKSVKKDQETGNMIKKIESFKKSLPKYNLTIEPPKWIADIDTYRQECDKEIDIYRKILLLVKKMSNEREISKARFLSQLIKKHDLVLAFDSRIISLHFIKRIAEELTKNVDFLVVTGNSNTAKQKAKEYFGFGSKKRKVIGFCSDAMSEGVNLQQASSVVLLDMPSVMRIAEQRIGRIDRMNSPHKEVEIYFPNDHDEFMLKTDKKFFLTAQTVENILGGNLELPDDQLEKWKIEKFTVKQAIKLYEEEKEKSETTFSDGIQDAFLSVKNLVYGNSNIIDITTYNSVKNSKSSFHSKVDVSKVKSTMNFAFFCIRGSKYYSPYWLYIDDSTLENRRKPVLKDLHQISRKLRSNLSNAVDLDLFENIEAEEMLKKKYISIIKDFEIENLPNKKRRAIKLLRSIISKSLLNLFIEERLRSVLIDLQKVIHGKIIGNFSIDYYQLAHNWIKIIQPRLINFKKMHKYQREIIHMNSESFKEDLIKNPISIEEFEKLRDDIITISPIENRIASCIIGIGNN